MSCVVSSLVQVMCDPHCRTQYGFQGLVQKEWVMGGHRFYSRINYHRDNDKEEVSLGLKRILLLLNSHRGGEKSHLHFSPLHLSSSFLIYSSQPVLFTLLSHVIPSQAPVFLLFLDCVWQLWSQYPSRFQLTEDFLLALHDSIHLPLFSTFLANCQRERCKRSQVLNT